MLTQDHDVLGASVTPVSGQPIGAIPSRGVANGTTSHGPPQTQTAGDVPESNVDVSVEPCLGLISSC